MDKTIYTLKLGGNDVTLKFNIGTLRRMKELTGKDPLEALKHAEGSMAAIEWTKYALVAGMKAADKNADVSNVDELFDDLMPEDATNIIKAFSAAYTPESASQEGGADTQQ